jgi:hypothetical protein
MYGFLKVSDLDYYQSRQPRQGFLEKALLEDEWMH